MYVDNALFFGKDKALVSHKKQEVMNTWECRDLGEASKFLCMCIKCKNGSIYLDQVNYLDKVLKHFGMENAIFTATPLPSGWCPSENDGEPDPRHQALYQLMICSLLYIMLGTHPDICYNVTKLAQFISNPSQEHVDKANISVAISLVLAIMCLSFEARLAEVLKVTLTLTGLLIQSNACL